MKFLSVLSAFLILFQSLNISLGDLARIDEFLEHANFHEKEYGDSLLVFISKHYGELKAEHQEQHQEEQEQHQKLPFQNQSCTHHTVNAFVLVTPVTPREKFEASQEEGADFYYPQKDCQGFRSGVFQPPKYS